MSQYYIDIILIFGNYSNKYVPIVRNIVIKYFLLIIFNFYKYNLPNKYLKFLELLLWKLK